MSTSQCNVANLFAGVLSAVRAIFVIIVTVFAIAGILMVFNIAATLIAGKPLQMRTDTAAWVAYVFEALSVIGAFIWLLIQDRFFTLIGTAAVGCFFTLILAITSYSNWVFEQLPDLNEHPFSLFLAGHLSRAVRLELVPAQIIAVAFGLLIVCALLGAAREILRETCKAGAKVRAAKAASRSAA